MKGKIGRFAWLYINMMNKYTVSYIRMCRSSLTNPLTPCVSHSIYSISINQAVSQSVNPINQSSFLSFLSNSSKVKEVRHSSYTNYPIK